VQGVGNFAPFLPLNWLLWQTSLEIEKNMSDLSSAPKRLSYGIKIAKIARGLCFAYNTKFVPMATSLEESEKLDLIKKIHANSIWSKDSENRSSRY